jgi:hypothetical protein
MVDWYMMVSRDDEQWMLDPSESIRFDISEEVYSEVV